MTDFYETLNDGQDQYGTDLETDDEYYNFCSIATSSVQIAGLPHNIYFFKYILFLEDHFDAAVRMKGCLYV